MQKKIIWVLFMALLTIFSCTTTQEVVSPIEPLPKEVIVSDEPPLVEEVAIPIVEKSLQIVATGNVQGALFPYSLIGESVRESSLLNISSYVKNERAKGESLLLVDVGAMLEESSLLSYFNRAETTGEHIIPKMMNAMEYDAATVAERDLINYSEVFLKIAGEAHYPYLMANATLRGTSERLSLPYLMVEKGGIKVALFGAVNATSLPPSLANLIILEPIEETLEWVLPQIKGENPDVIVGLFDAGGVESDLSDFDLIISANEFDAEAKTVVTARVTMSDTGVVSVEKGLLKGASFEVDQPLFDKLEGSFELAKGWFNSPVGAISESISSRDSLFTDSKFVDLIHMVQLEKSGAELSIAPVSVFDEVLLEGEVKIRDFYRIYPRDNYLVTIEMSGEEIKEYLELSYGGWYNQMKSLDDLLLGELNWPEWESLAGLNYVVDITKAAGERVTIKTARTGEPFRKERLYRVVLNSERALGEGSYLKELNIDVNRVEPIGDKGVRDYLIETFREVEIVDPPLDNNWLVIPNLWLQRGMKNSYPTIFAP
ncbi:MAG: 5'-nucleotidase C-terminal domain-containing protein [Sphaerochaetaceae bacterium]